MNSATKAIVQAAAFGLAFGLTIPLNWSFWNLRSVEAGTRPLDTINVRKVNLVDENGVVRGFLAGTTRGAYANFHGKDGTALSITPDHLDFVDSTYHVAAVYGAEGLTIRERIQMSALSDGPVLQLFDKAGNLRTAIGAMKLESKTGGAYISTAESSVVLLGRDGAIIWKLP